MRKILPVLVSLFLFAGFVSAQVEDERLRQENEERTRLAIEASQNAMAPPYQSFVSQLMPASEGAWIISIGKRGGILGNPATLVGAVNSSGIRACTDPNTDFATKLIDMDLITPIETAIASLDLKKLAKGFGSSKDTCSDCQIYTMEVVYREKKKAKSYFFEWSFFPEDSGEIKSLYQSVIASANCS